MLCDVCREREGVVQVTKMEKDSVTLENLCEKCAAARGIETSVSMPKHPLSDFLSGVQQQLGSQQADAARCTFCSTTLREFRNSGRLGCMGTSAAVVSSTGSSCCASSGGLDTGPLQWTRPRVVKAQ